MDLIVTHDNADFDALSSLVAASKLYPESRLLLPGSQERSVRNFLSLIKDKIRIESEKTCRFDDVKRLIIVDNHHASRIGKAAELLKRKEVRVVIYDHHVRSSSDIKADVDIREEVGSTVTIILKELQKNGKLRSLTPLEATLMLIGIYQETGSLSYSQTTKDDVDMVAELLEIGGKLGAVNAYLNRELSSSELTVFIEMLETVEVDNIAGTKVAFFYCRDTDFHGEASSVVHKLRDVENFPVIFGLFENRKRTKIIARSRAGSVEVNKILRMFKGGGHRTAASARAYGVSAADVKKQLKAKLREVIPPVFRAGEVMSAQVKTLSENEKVVEAIKKLDEWGHKGAPVKDVSGKVKAVITKGDLKKALKRSMGHSRIKGYMSSPPVTVEPSTPLDVLETIIVQEGKGRLPVIENGRLVGIVTRTDVLKNIHRALFPEQIPHVSREQMISKMKNILPRQLNDLIVKIGALADKEGRNAFLVGGFVRDLLVAEKNYDLDIVVDKDAIAFATQLANILDGALVPHAKFGTATVVKPWPQWLGEPFRSDDKFKIDVATARREEYAEPGSLPKVSFSDIKNDLYRRDFTINAMALCINKERFGDFVDFFGGLEDLEKGLIRVLHDKSFLDDPTRIFRAVRFEKRFGFKVEHHTEYLIKHALRREMFGRTENQRIRDELIRMLSEPTALESILRMKELNELRFIHPNLKLSRSFRSRFRNIGMELDWYRSSVPGKRKLDLWLINFMILISELSLPETKDVLKRFVFNKSSTTRVERCKAFSVAAIEKLSENRELKPSRIWEILIKFSHESLLYMLSEGINEQAEERIRSFLKKYSTVKLCVSGADIKNMGVVPGPVYRKTLSDVLRAKLDGMVSGRKEELFLIRDILRQDCGEKDDE